MGISPLVTRQPTALSSGRGWLFRMQPSQLLPVPLRQMVLRFEYETSISLLIHTLIQPIAAWRKMVVHRFFLMGICSSMGLHSTQNLERIPQLSRAISRLLMGRSRCFKVISTLEKAVTLRMLPTLPLLKQQQSGCLKTAH